MKARSSRTIYAYWNEKRGDRLAPDRGDIEPGAIRTALGDSFILSCEPAHPFRLAGTRVCALFGHELKDTDFVDLWARGSAAPVQDLMMGIADEVAGAVAGATALTVGGQSCELELLALPLYHGGRTCRRLLCALSPILPPAWLGRDRIATMTLGTVRNLGAAFVPFSPEFAARPVSERRPLGIVKHGLVVYPGGRD